MPEHLGAINDVASARRSSALGEAPSSPRRIIEQKPLGGSPVKWQQSRWNLRSEGDRLTLSALGRAILGNDPSDGNNVVAATTPIG